MNDFTYDPHCVALYRFENGALTIDSKGSNTLTAYNNPVVDTTNFKEGESAIDFESTSKQYLSIADSDLSDNFLGKAGTSNRTGTILFWIRPESAGTRIICEKFNKSYQHSFIIGHGQSYPMNTINIIFYLYRDGTDIFDSYNFGTNLICDASHWYHIALVLEEVNGKTNYRMRIYDATASQLLAADKTGTWDYILNVGTADFQIAGRDETVCYDGLMDEYVVFNDVLTVDQIDAIRNGNGTYIAFDYETQNAFTLLYDVATSASGCTCDNEDSDFPLENAIEDYDRPFKRFHSNDTTETTIELIYETAINTIFLGNCNFSSFKIKIEDDQYDLNTVMDKDHGRYNAVVRLLPITGITTFKIIIPAQSTVNGESFFAIGSIVAGTRVELTVKPQYPVAKTLIENIFEKRFDGQNREVQEIGRPYHLLEFNWNGIDEDYFDEIENVIREMGQDGIGIVHEKWDDYEASYLCQLNGDFPFSRIKDFYAHQISFREII